METNRSWSIDDIRLNFQFGCEAGWLVKNGKITDMVKTLHIQASLQISGGAWIC